MRFVKLFSLFLIQNILLLVLKRTISMSTQKTFLNWWVRKQLQFVIYKISLCDPMWIKFNHLHFSRALCAAAPSISCTILVSVQVFLFPFLVYAQMILGHHCLKLPVGCYSGVRQLMFSNIHSTAWWMNWSRHSLWNNCKKEKQALNLI